MHGQRLVLCLVAALGVAPPALAAQQEVLAELVSRDSATRLELTREQVVFAFTERGVRNIENDVAASQGDRVSNYRDFVFWASVDGGVRGMRMTFDLEDVREARYGDGALTLLMRGRSPRAEPSDRRGSFVFEGVPEEAARRFVDAFYRAKAARR
jgi:hypothetical protein